MYLGRYVPVIVVVLSTRSGVFLSLGTADFTSCFVSIVLYAALDHLYQAYILRYKEMTDNQTTKQGKASKTRQATVTLCCTVKLCFQVCARNLCMVFNIKC